MFCHWWNSMQSLDCLCCGAHSLNLLPFVGLFGPKKCTTVSKIFWPQKSNQWQWFGRTCTITKKFQRLHRNPSIERYKLHPKKIRILNWWNQEVNNSLICIYLCNHGQSKEKHENDQKSCEFLTSWSQIGCPIVNHSSNQGFSTAELGINSKDQKHEEKQ